LKAGLISAYPQAIAKRFSTRAHLEMCKQGEHASRLFREWLLSAEPPLPTGRDAHVPPNLQSPTAHFVASAALDGGTVERSFTFDLDSVCGGGGVIIGRKFALFGFGFVAQCCSGLVPWR